MADPQTEIKEEKLRSVKLEADPLGVALLPSELAQPGALASALESVLFSSPEPQSLADLLQAFEVWNIKREQVREALAALEKRYQQPESGIVLEQVARGFQLRTKTKNQAVVQKLLKAKKVRVTGASLEVLSIVAYKGPLIKQQVDEIRGVDSGHLLRSLMQRGLIKLAGKSEEPGRPLLYGTTKKFLELFALKSLKDLPSLSEMEQLEASEATDTMESLAQKLRHSPADLREQDKQLNEITDELNSISTKVDFEPSSAEATEGADNADSGATSSAC